MLVLGKFNEEMVERSSEECLTSSANIEAFSSVLWTAEDTYTCFLHGGH